VRERERERLDIVINLTYRHILTTNKANSKGGFKMNVKYKKPKKKMKIRTKGMERCNLEQRKEGR
jgi:hypothetical protein